MANKTIHELVSASTVSNDFEFAVYDTDSNSTKKASVSLILNSGDTLYAAEDEEEPPEEEEVDFTSQDTELTPASTVGVDLLAGTDSWSQRFVKISQMFKNIRYLFSKIGDTVMGTTSTTITGAIAEHESAMNTKIEAVFTAPTGTQNGDLYYIKLGKIIVFSGQIELTTTLSSGTNLFTGLPTPAGSIAGFRTVCTTQGTWFDFYVTQDNILRVGGNWSSIGWYRLSGAYIIY